MADIWFFPGTELKMESKEGKVLLALDDSTVKPSSFYFPVSGA